MTASSSSATVTTRGDHEILIERELAAPPELVWKAWTTPELVARWWVGLRGTATLVEIDLVVGGKWRYVMETPTGFEVAFHGEYREIEAPHRLVSTEVYEAVPDGEALNTLTFTPLPGGRTKLDLVVVHALKEHRDMHLESGMEGGLQEALDLLEQIASELE